MATKIDADLKKMTKSGWVTGRCKLIRVGYVPSQLHHPAGAISLCNDIETRAPALASTPAAVADTGNKQKHELLCLL